MAISNTLLTTSPANIFISSGNTAVSTMYFCNNSGSPVTINVYALPNGSTVADANVQIYNGVQIASGDTFVVDMEKLVLANGDKLSANASVGSSVTATLSWVRI